jgi:hypothetical protein
MEKIDKSIFIVGVIFLMIFCGGLTLVILNEPKREVQIDIQIKDTINDVIPIDTSIGMNNTNIPWPIKVIRVEPNTNEFIEGDWIVTTENGATYYTNEIMRVGQIAFYLGNNGEIITNYGKNKLDPREW